MGPLRRRRLQELATEILTEFRHDASLKPSSFVRGKHGMLFLKGDGASGFQNLFLMPLDTGTAEPVVPVGKLQSVLAQETAGKKDSEAMELLQERQRSRSKGIFTFIYNQEDDLACFPAQGSLFAVHNASSPSKGKRVLEPLRATNGYTFENAIDFKFCPGTSDIISFVKEGDLFLYSRLAKLVLPITNVRQEYGSHFVSAGTPSYIIQEEFDRYTGYWWQTPAPDAPCYRILYEVVDERDVPRTVVHGMTFADSPSDFTFPKPGDSNGRVTCNVVEIPKTLFNSGDFSAAARALSTVSLGTQVTARFPWAEYIVRLGWIPERDEVWLQALDREQHRLELFVVPLSSFQPYAAPFTALVPPPGDAAWPTLASEQTHVWINVHDVCEFVACSSGYRLLWCSEETGFRHMYAVSLTPGSQRPTRVALTSGEWMVKSLCRVCKDSSSITFTATKDTPLETHAYTMQLGGWKEWTDTGALPTASPPALITNKGFCHQVHFIDDTTFVDMLSSTQSAPQCRVVRPGTNPINFCTRQLPRLYAPPKTFSFQSKNGGHMVYSHYFAARTAAPTAEPRPTMVYVYGGPHVQLVTNEFNASRFSLAHLLTECGFNVLVTDGRGSTNHGLKHEAPLQYAMGTFEVEDQVEALQVAAANPDLCIDMNSIGVYGWSYGGYMSLMCLAQRPDIFKVALAGAPVTDWRGYDTGYTERYMGLPSTHEEGYNAGSVLLRAKDFPEEPGRLLLLHGLSDENVHFAHTASLINELTKEGKPYSLQVFPKERHGLRSTHASVKSMVEQAAFAQQALMP